jgi:hypothetical protein
MPITAEKDLTLELSAVTAFASGLLLQLAMRVTGIVSRVRCPPRRHKLG